MAYPFMFCTFNDILQSEMGFFISEAEGNLIHASNLPTNSTQLDVTQFIQRINNTMNLLTNGILDTNETNFIDVDLLRERNQVISYYNQK